METSRDSTSTPGLRSTSRSAVSRTLRAWKPSAATAATASVVRWRRSWWSTSATEVFSLRRSATRPFTTERLSFSEVASGRRRSRRSSATNKGLPRDLHHLVGLDDVTLLDVLEVLQPDAALIAGRHRAHVLLEAAQGVDAAVVDDHAVAHQPGPAATVHLPGGDVRAHHHADARHAEQLPHLGRAELALLELGA